MSNLGRSLKKTRTIDDEKGGSGTMVLLPYEGLPHYNDRDALAAHHQRFHFFNQGTLSQPNNAGKVEHSSIAHVVMLDKRGKFLMLRDARTSEPIDAYVVVVAKRSKRHRGCSFSGAGLNGQGVQQGAGDSGSENEDDDSGSASSDDDDDDYGAGSDNDGLEEDIEGPTSDDALGVDDGAGSDAMDTTADSGGLGPASATELGVTLSECMFQFSACSLGEKRRRRKLRHSSNNKQEKGTSISRDEESSMRRTRELQQQMERSEAEYSLFAHSDRGRGGGFGGGRSFGGGGRRALGGGGGARRIAPAPVRRAPGFGVPAPRRFLAAPSYGRYHHRGGWAGRYRPFVPFLPGLYASLVIPWGFWYPRTQYVYLNSGVVAQNNLPALMEEIPPNAPVDYINQRLNILRATYSMYVQQGYQIVPRFDESSGRGHFAWVSTQPQMLQGRIYGEGTSMKGWF